jgi:kinesin family member 1
LTRLEETGRTRHAILLRERLAPPSLGPPSLHDFTKSEKDACNMVAKAGCGGIPSVNSMFCNTNTADGAPMPHQPDPSVYEPWEMTDRERHLTTKCVKLIQGTIFI